MPTSSTFKSNQSKTRAQWRKWLTTNNKNSKGIWLIIKKKGSNMVGITLEDAVEEALCFGWIDGKLNPVDAYQYKLYMAPRKSKSVWSKRNKQRIRRLIKEGQMTPAGLEKINEAKKNGSWNQLDVIERDDIPLDLRKELGNNGKAKRNYDCFNISSKRMILYWIASAKSSETRRKRITETVRLAEKNLNVINSKHKTKDNFEQ